MSDPRVLSVFGVVFVLLGLYNVNLGFRRVREARARGQTIAWYRQINILTGVEYILLTLVFLLSFSVRSKLFPSSLNGIIIPFYLGLLLATGVLAILVISQAISNARKPKGQPAERNGASVTSERIDDELTPEQRAASLQRRRERRRNAAAARRRRGGKA